MLAFIVTWTPYSVLTVANAFLGKESADKYIPGVVWDFSYYLCYINSTVNPVLYALCNAAFRRTYVRILTCRWGGRSRQPYGNRYYYGWICTFCIPSDMSWYEIYWKDMTILYFLIPSLISIWINLITIKLQLTYIFTL